MPVSINLRMGTLVRIIDDRALIAHGVDSIGQIVEARPQNGGYLVRPLNQEHSYGWGYKELAEVSHAEATTHKSLPFVEDKIVAMEPYRPTLGARLLDPII